MHSADGAVDPRQAGCVRGQREHSARQTGWTAPPRLEVRLLRPSLPVRGRGLPSHHAREEGEAKRMREREGDGLSPEELAPRIGASGRENAEVRGEVGSKFGGPMSRRAFLGRAGTAAVGAMAAGTLLDQVAAEAAPAGGRPQTLLRGYRGWSTSSAGCKRASLRPRSSGRSNALQANRR